MTAAYTTTAHHFDHCKVGSVHRRWPHRDEVAVHLERWTSGGRRGDEVTFYVDNLDAQRLCRGLLNIIGNNPEFHDELTEMMRVQQMPE